MQIIRHHLSSINVHPVERWVSVAAGGALTLSGLSRGRGGILRTLTGAAMIQRGLSGHCRAYELLGYGRPPRMPHSLMSLESARELLRQSAILGKGSSSSGGSWKTCLVSCTT